MKHHLSLPMASAPGAPVYQISTPPRTLNGTKAFHVKIARNSTMPYWTDAGGDPIEYLPEAPDFVSIGPGQAALKLDTARVTPDSRFARITTSDLHGSDAHDCAILVTGN